MTFARPLVRAVLRHPARLAGRVAGVAHAAGSAAARAQGGAEGGAQRGAAGPLPYDQTLSASPLLIPLGAFTAEYERRLGVRGLTVAGAGTYSTTTQLYPRRDRWAEGRVMYYPGGAALEGPAVGVTAGAHRAERKYREDSAGVLAHDGGATLGAMVTYNAYYGPRRRFFVGPGLGFKHVLRSVAVNSPLSQNYFEGRAAIGVAF